MVHRIDVATWKRREHFTLFANAGQPFFSVTVEVDVTSLWEFCRRTESSFFLASLFVTLDAINATEALRLRMRDGEVWLHDRVGLGTPIMRADETFDFGRFDLAESFEEFRAAGEATIARIQAGRALDTMADQDDLVYHTTLPWLRFTAFTNAIAGNVSIPRVAFGKSVREGSRQVMPVALEVHHALVDGLDAGRFFERLEGNLGRWVMPGDFRDASR